MTVTETPTDVVLVARKAFKCAGQDIAQGETFTVDAARASQLERTGFATVAPEGAAAFGVQITLEKTERGRARVLPNRDERQAATRATRQTMAAQEHTPEPEHEQSATLTMAAPNPALRRRILQTDARLDALEAGQAALLERLDAVLARLEAEPAQTPRKAQALTRKVDEQ